MYETKQNPIIFFLSLLFLCAVSSAEVGVDASNTVFCDQTDKDFTLTDISKCWVDSAFVECLRCFEQDATATDQPLNRPFSPESTSREVSLVIERYHSGVDNRRFGEPGNLIFNCARMLRYTSNNVTTSTDCVPALSLRSRNVILLI